MSQHSATSAPQAAVLKRAIEHANGSLSTTAARALLRFKLAEQDRKRLHELLTKNQDDALSPQEREELEGYLQVGMFLDLVRAKARAALRRAGKDAGPSDG
jgi:hypothetical protein